MRQIAKEQQNRWDQSTKVLKKYILNLNNIRKVLIMLTLEALFQNDIKPSLNTKDEHKSRTLTIKF